jgi:uncharacterized protein (TIGR02647 family)
MMPRLYREAPINTIWEGSGNVQCLDVLRAIRKEPESLQAILAEIGRAKGEHPLLDSAMKQLPDLFRDADTIEYRARQITEKLALDLQASILVQSGNALISDSFIQARLGDGSGHVYGMLPAGIDLVGIITMTRDNQEDIILPFTSGSIEELNLLLQFDNTTLEHGIKVHSSARQEVISACQSLFDKDLVSQPDGGYLTDAGIEALAHVQVLAGLLAKK